MTVPRMIVYTEANLGRVLEASDTIEQDVIDLAARHGFYVDDDLDDYEEVWEVEEARNDLVRKAMIFLATITAPDLVWEWDDSGGVSLYTKDWEESMTTRRKRPAKKVGRIVHMPKPADYGEADVPATLRTEREASLRASKLVVAIADAKKQAADIADRLARDETELLDLMTRLGQEELKVTSDGVQIKAKPVHGMRAVIDTEKLKKKIGRAMWLKVSTLVLDKKKLDAFVASGDIPTLTVAAVTEEIPSKPYVRITRR